jgi:hypothetical protein
MFNSLTIFKSHRRAFLTKGIAATASTGLFGFTTISGKPRVTETCLGSASDAIILLLDLLFSVLDEAYVEAGKNLRRASLNCADALQELYNEIDELVAKIKSRRTASDAGRRMEELLEIGRTNVRFLRSAEPRGGGTPLVLASLALINEEVSKAAQDLLPSGDIVLDEDAKRILQKIIDTVRVSRDVPAATRLAEKQYSVEIALIRERVAIIKDAIFDASAAAESDSKTQARKRMNDAITALNQMPMNSDPSSNPREPAAKIMIKCLQGARTWVEMGSHSVPIVVDDKTGKIMLNPSIKKHHTGEGMEASSSYMNMPAPAQGVGGLLGNLCGPNNLGRRCACYWAAGMAWLSSQNADERFNLIDGALIKFTCNPSSNKTSLVKALAGKR